jgi:hypothetical protein
MRINSKEYDFLKDFSLSTVNDKSKGKGNETLNCSEIFLKRMKRLGILKVT